MAKNFGMRHNPADGKKYIGWQGVHINIEGKEVTEHSIGVGMGKDSKETEIPMIVPETTKEEIDIILNKGQPTPIMIKKAIAHAEKRVKEGKSPFKNPEDDK
jgi:hypothetical protein